MAKTAEKKGKYDHLPYRQSAAAIILNKHDEIMVLNPSYFSRKYWKCPSGGIEDGETTREALMRELMEELGTNNFEFVKESEAKMVYIWPDHHIKLFKNKYKGQSKTFFILRFHGKNSEIKLNKKENKMWRWAKKDKLARIFKYESQAEFIENILNDPELNID